VIQDGIKIAESLIAKMYWHSAGIWEGALKWTLDLISGYWWSAISKKISSWVGTDKSSSTWTKSDSSSISWTKTSKKDTDWS